MIDAAGHKIFRERADVSCIRCHMVDNQGGVVGRIHAVPDRPGGVQPGRWGGARAGRRHTDPDPARRGRIGLDRRSRRRCCGRNRQQPRCKQGQKAAHTHHNRLGNPVPSRCV